MIAPEEQISSALKKGKLSGSWLISGPYGVGKKKFAEHLSAFLVTGNWDAKISFHSDIKWIERSLTEDEKKENVKAILAGKAIEEKTTDRARKREITVDDIRDGIKFLSLKSSGTNPRVLIVNLADEMNENAANALLKMLEEPYPNTLILLLCQNIGKLLPTIRSRCRKIVIRPLSEAELIQKIKEEIPFCKDAELLASLSDGSIGLAKDIYKYKGIEIYQKVLSFMVPAKQIDFEKLSTFADSFVKDDMAYGLLKIFVLDKLSSMIKEYSLIDCFKTEKLMDVYNFTNKLFADIDFIYLDKKQSIVNIFLKIAEELNHD